MSELRIEVRDGSHCIAVWRNLLLQVWTDDPSTERNRTMRDIGRRFLLTTKGPVGAVVVVGAHCPVPQPAAREHVVGFLSDIGERAKGLALVFEGEGFLAAASRLAMMGMMSAARFPFDYRVARQVSEGEQFLLPLLPNPWTRGELTRVIDSLRPTPSSKVGSR